MKHNILYTGGTFDLFHAGHVNFLKHCKKISDHVVVSLNTDEFIFKYKKKHPIIPYVQRELVVSSCRYVDSVIKNTGEFDSKPIILEIKPNIIAVGDDWAKKDYYSQMNFTQTWLDENEITLVYIPYTIGISSTIIKNNMQ
jgi:glycerol-3-phosphate cytidylyltransferase